MRSTGAVKSISAGFKALRQGEVREYTQLLEDSRRHAVDRMIENARLLGANGVVAMRFDSSEMGQGLTEIVAYGTAVVVRPGVGLTVPEERRSLLGDADRDRLVAVLREHYAAGRMDTEELRRRVGIVLAAGLRRRSGAGPGRPAAAGHVRRPGLRYSGQHRGGLLRPRPVPLAKRHAQVDQPQPGWVPTAERFRDPSSGTIMRVWTDPADGSRHYVPTTTRSSLGRMAAYADLRSRDLRRTAGRPLP